MRLVTSVTLGCPASLVSSIRKLHSVRSSMLVQPFAVLPFCSWPLGLSAFWLFALSCGDRLFGTKVLPSSGLAVLCDWTYMRDCTEYIFLI